MQTASSFLEDKLLCDSRMGTASAEIDLQTPIFRESKL